MVIITDVICLVLTIVIGLVVNTLALVYLIQKNTVSTLKDKVVFMLSLINCLHSIGFAMELYAAVHGK